jgi:hypothetical protein
LQTSTRQFRFFNRDSSLELTFAFGDVGSLRGDAGSPTRGDLTPAAAAAGAAGERGDFAAIPSGTCTSSSGEPNLNGFLVPPANALIKRRSSFCSIVSGSSDMFKYFWFFARGLQIKLFFIGGRFSPMINSANTGDIDVE